MPEKLADGDMERMLADKVMGWVVPFPISSFYLTWESEPDGYYDTMSVSDWRPLTDWRNAGEIMEAMRIKRWWCKVQSPFTSDSQMYTVRFGKAGFVGWDERACPRYQDPSGPRAIGIAALMAVEAITKEDVQDASA